MKKGNEKKRLDSALIGRQQLLIKAQLQRNATIAKQQLVIKAALANPHANGAEK